MNNSQSVLSFSIVIATSIIISFIKLKKPYQNLPLLIAIVLLFFFNAFRGELTGTDTDRYRYIYSNILDPQTFLQNFNDPFYTFLMIRLRSIYDDGGLLFQVLNSLVQFFSIYIAWILIKLKTF